MNKIKVFLDTNILLKVFLSYRKLLKGHIELSEMPNYINDEETLKFTFEKCIYESYLAFRGIGGKKPDEGRGDWADRFLTSLNDPKTVSKLISQFHSDNQRSAFYWLNLIEELECYEFGKDVDLIFESEKEEYLEEEKKLKELLNQRELFLNLCDQFCTMINFFGIKLLTYLEIFGVNKENNRLVSFTRPSDLDSFVRRTAIPSEDFEIIYSAERIGADIFVTDDKKLITCSNSLGLSSFLKPSSFCRSDEYEEKIINIMRMKYLNS